MEKGNGRYLSGGDRVRVVGDFFSIEEEEMENIMDCSGEAEAKTTQTLKAGT